MRLGAFSVSMLIRILLTGYSQTSLTPHSTSSSDLSSVSTEISQCRPISRRTCSRLRCETDTSSTATAAWNTSKTSGPLRASTRLNGIFARARRSSPQPAVFVDRDGTLNRLRDYVRTPEEFELLPGVAEAIRRLNAAEKRVVVITNQPVLARGECSFAEMRRIHAKMDTALGRHGAYLDGLYLCPHHPDGGFFGEVASLKVICDCRKPKPGLIERAITEMNIDRSASFFVGDSWRDMAAARNAGITSVLVRTGEDGQAYLRDAQFIVEDFAAAVDLILDESCQSEPLPGPEATA
jgi:histidinol-phosphate phosphatase family protein